MKLAENLKRHGFSGRVHLVHGFNVSDGGEGSTDRFAAHYAAQGFEILEFDTRWRRGLLRDLLSVRFGNAKRAEKLARRIRPGDVLVGHSNGCALIHGACRILCAVGGAESLVQIFHNPALDVDTPASPNVRGRYIFHGSCDWIVRISSRLIHHEWGAMGQRGYVERDADKRDGVTLNAAYDHIGIPDSGHSRAFSTPERVAHLFGYHSRFLQSLT